MIPSHQFTFNADSALQLARTAMSPANHSEHSWKCRQRTGPLKKGAGHFLPEIFVCDALNSDSALQLARTEMSPAKHSRKQLQRTGPRKKSASNLPMTPRHPCTSNDDSALQLARIDMSPAQRSEHSRKHR